MDDDRSNSPSSAAPSPEAHAAAAGVSQTQAEVTNKITDVFGFDSDDDDEDFLRKKKTQPAAVTVSSAAPLDSDDEEADDRAAASRGSSSSSTTTYSRLSKKSSKKLKKHHSSSSASASASATATAPLDSSDDEDVRGTAEDYAFIDSEEEGDNADIVKEYNNKRQHFHEEDGGGHAKKKKRPDEPKPAHRLSKEDENNPLMKTLQYMREHKTSKVVLNDEQRTTLSRTLIDNMDRALKDDDILIANRQPALNKLTLLPTVQSVCGMQQLQGMLLDHDVLSVLKMWIDPIDNGRSLPTLTLRAAIYDILLQLPCQLDHLKRSSIGKTIVALRKHKAETPENKVKLKAIMEKWSRPIFNKSADMRALALERATPEQKALARERQLQRMQELESRAGGGAGRQSAASSSAAAAARPSSAADADGESTDAAADASDAGDVAAAGHGGSVLASSLDASQVHEVDNRQRVRTPYSTGFYFTARAEGCHVAEAAKRTKKVSDSDASIDVETGEVRRIGGGGSRKSGDKRPVQLHKLKSLAGAGVKKPFAMQVK